MITKNGSYVITMAAAGSTTITDRIVVATGITADITIAGLSIDRSAGGCAFDIRGATVTLTLTGNNVLRSGNDHAGINVTAGSSLTVTDASTGTLSVFGGGNGAGIGGIYSTNGSLGTAGVITINGGTVNATGGIGGAGIGGGWRGSGGTITITGGSVIASGNTQAAGIGSGCQMPGSAYPIAGGVITVSGGTVTANGGDQGSGIGGGYLASGGNITISGGTVTATGGNSCSGIGGSTETVQGRPVNPGIISISGGKITAIGTGNGTGIGGGNGEAGSLSISGGTIDAIKGQSCRRGDVEFVSGSLITITGGSLKCPSISKKTGDIQPTNGSDSVYLVVLTVGDPAIPNAVIDNTGIAGYGIKDIVADSEGKLYFWLPVSTGCPIMVANANVDYFYEQVVVRDKGLNMATLTADGSTASPPNSAGDFYVTGDAGYYYSENTLMIFADGTYNISMAQAGNTTTSDRIFVLPGVNADITLDGVSIDFSATGDFNSAGNHSADMIAGERAFDISNTTVNLTLLGNNVLKSGYAQAGVSAPAGTTLTITVNSSGTLAAIGGAGGAGIGGSGGTSTGSSAGGVITINGGTVTATGGAGMSASYGSGYTRECGGGAGIGGGGGGFARAGGPDIFDPYVGASGGVTTINGGSVTATGGGAGIGGGGGITSLYSFAGGYAGEIIIAGGTVIATGGSDCAGIGGGLANSGGKITINGGSVTATGGDYGAGIGGGNYPTGSFTGANNDTPNIITINDGYINATGGGAGIGGGYRNAGGVILINDGNVNATGNSGAGIGGGETANAGEITINGGTVIALGKAGCAGIGAGRARGSGSINITGGNITATGGSIKVSNDNYDGAGIGSGGGSAGGDATTGNGVTITISGGKINATGGNSGDSNDGGAAGIGGGNNRRNGYIYGGGGDITISGGTITATKGATSNQGDIGCGSNVVYASGIITITGGSLNCTSSNKTGKILPTNGSVPVYLATLTVGEPAIPNAKIESAAIAGITYGDNDLFTDGAGKLYFWLPVSEGSRVAAVSETVEYWYQSVSVKEHGLSRAVLTSNGSSSNLTGDFHVTGNAADYHYENNVLQILADGTYSISMAQAGNTTTTDRIFVAPGVNADISLDGVSINLNITGGLRF